MRIFAHVVQHRVAASIVSILMLFLLSYGITELSFDADYTAYFDPTDALIPVYNEMNERYGLNENVVVILNNQQGSMLDPAAWSLLSRLTEDLAKLPYVLRSQSASNYSKRADSSTATIAQNNTRHESDATNGVQTPKALPAAVQGLFLSKDRSHALINLVYSLPDKQKPAELLHTLTLLRAGVDDAIAQSEIKVTSHYSGTLALNEAYINVVRHDLKIFFPFLLVAFLVCLYLFFRSLRIILSIMLVALMAASGAFGLAGWLGFTLASIHSFVPVIIATLSIAGSVHLVSSYFNALNDGLSLQKNLDYCVSINLVPLTLTSMSTALGFLALSFSPSPPVQRVGYIVASGVFIAWILNLSLLLALLPAYVQGHNLKKHLIINMKPLIRIGENYRFPVIVVFAVLGLIAIYGVSRSTINDNVFAYFDEELSFRKDTKLVEKLFSGVQEISYEVTAALSSTVLDSGYFSKLQSVSVWLSSQSEVKRVITMTEVLPEAVSLAPFSGLDSQDKRRWWDEHTPNSAHQYVSGDLDASRILLYLNNLDATQLIEFDRLAREKIEAIFTPAQVNGGTGASLLFAHLGKRNARSMVLSLGAALVLISIIIGAIARSRRVIWVSLVCNILPVAAVFSAWTLQGGYISLGGAIVMGMIMGIVVDDTVYLLNRYMCLKESGHRQPVQEALTVVGPALIITSTTLCVGLSVGVLSDFLPIYTMSLLSVAIIVLALIGDIVLLPVLLLSGQGRRHNSST